MVVLHFGMHIALSKYPSLDVRALAIVDDINFLGCIRDTACIYFEMKIVFKEVFGINLNLRKSSLLLLQLHTVVDPVAYMEPVYQLLPELRQLPLATKGTRIVGVPIGTTDYVNDEIQKELADCDQEFQKLVRFPFANCLILLIRYCCNRKLMYLQRNVSPCIMLPHATQFDSMIDQMMEQSFNLKLTSDVDLENIVPGSRLTSEQIIQLAKFQLRDSEKRGGVGLTSMASITVPAYMAATFCHLLSTVPLLKPNQTILTRNGSSDLFTSPILEAHAKFVDMGAKVLSINYRASQDAPSDSALAFPDVDLFFDPNLTTVFSQFSKPMRRLSQQNVLTQWMQLNNPILQHVQKVVEADDSLRARMSHLSQCEISGPHRRFDLPPDKELKFCPTAFLGNILSMINSEFSSVQLGQYLRLILGLDFPPPTTSDGHCFCGRANDVSGYHRLNCSRWAGRSWAQGHNVVVAALGFENRRLGLSVVDIDAAMRRQCTHFNSQARGDILIRSTDLEITDCALGYGCPRKQFVIDVKTVAMVDSNGKWGERWNAQMAQYDNPGMSHAEQEKYRKHELAYSHTGYSFVAFICSSFGALGPSAIRYLAALAMLELRQHQAVRSLQGMDPLDDSEKAQYRASCFRSSSARIAAAMAKATIMRLAGTPSLPGVAPVPRQHLARNIRGFSDFCDLRQAPRGSPPSPSTPLPSPPPPSRAPFPAPPLNLLRPPSRSLSPSDRLPLSPS
jgi:hypothetical protein